MEELGNLAPSPGPWYSSTWQRQHEPCLSLADESLHPTATSHVCQFHKRIRYKDLIYVCCCNLYFGGSNHCNPAAQALELQPTTCLSLCWQVFEPEHVVLQWISDVRYELFCSTDITRSLSPHHKKYTGQLEKVQRKARTSTSTEWLYKNHRIRFIKIGKDH